MAKKKTAGYEILKWAKALDNQTMLAVDTTLEISSMTKGSKLISLADMSKVIDKALLEAIKRMIWRIAQDEGGHILHYNEVISEILNMPSTKQENEVNKK